MNKKYLCPKHDEKTPSAHAYSDGYKCYGCGATGPLSELGLPPGERIEITYVEDLPASIESIKALPKVFVRNFAFHADSRGYYLLWPDGNYYKKRIYGAEAGNKYRGPSGHPKPPFVAHSSQNSNLALVEGEFNALSLASLGLPIDVISPGGAGDFYSHTGKKLLAQCVHYESIFLLVDADAAGAQAAIEAKSRLIVLGCSNVQMILLKRDFNDIHTEEGQEILRRLAISLGLSGGVRDYESAVPTSGETTATDAGWGSSAILERCGDQCDDN